MRLLLALGAAACLALAPPAFAQDVLGEDSSIVTGAGSTFGFPIVSRWAQSYRRMIAGGPELAMAGTGLEDPPTRPALAYEPVGSLAGIMRASNRSVDFGATDMPLRSTELVRLGLAQFPIVIGGVAVVVNLDGVAPGQLKLTGPLLAEIYLGRVRNWSDAAIRELNPDLRLPEAPIAAVYRSDGSGTTFNFTDFLAKANPLWRDRVGVDLLVNWPVGVGTGARGNEGVSQRVRQTKNAIGYVEFAHALKTRLSYAAIRNQAGRFVAPGTRAFQAAAAQAPWSGSNDFGLTLTDAPGEHAYPIVASVFAVVPKATSPRRTRQTLQFFQWALEKGERDAAELGYVPLPLSLVDQIKDYWKRSMLLSG